MSGRYHTQSRKECMGTKRWHNSCPHQICYSSMTVSLAKQESPDTSSESRTTQLNRDLWSQRHDQRRLDTQNPIATYAEAFGDQIKEVMNPIMGFYD